MTLFGIPFRSDNGIGRLGWDREWIMMFVSRRSPATGYGVFVRTFKRVSWVCFSFFSFIIDYFRCLRVFIVVAAFLRRKYIEKREKTFKATYLLSTFLG